MLSPVDKTHGIKYLGPDSFYRPEVYRYLTKIQKYKIAEHYTGLICLPELDLPGINGISLKQWIQKLSQEKTSENYQIAIISNWFGIIPLQIADIYPLSQHEGDPEIIENSNENRILFESIKEFLKFNSNLIKQIKILIPSEYNNEYNEKEQFNAGQHLINYLETVIITSFPESQIVKFTTIEELIQNLE
jgi:hypothetical protein